MNAQQGCNSRKQKWEQEIEKLETGMTLFFTETPHIAKIVLLGLDLAFLSSGKDLNIIQD